MLQENYSISQTINLSDFLKNFIEERIVQIHLERDQSGIWSKESR